MTKANQYEASASRYRVELVMRVSGQVVARLVSQESVCIA
jgi:hypothetical protein